MNPTTLVITFRNLLGSLRAGGPGRRTMVSVGEALQLGGYDPEDIMKELRRKSVNSLADEMAAEWLDATGATMWIVNDSLVGGDPAGDDEDENGELPEGTADVFITPAGFIEPPIADL